MTEIKKASEQINRLRIDKVDDRLTIAKILVDNDYTVRLVRVRPSTGQKATTYLAYWENVKR